MNQMQQSQQVQQQMPEQQPQQQGNQQTQQQQPQQQQIHQTGIALNGKHTNQISLIAGNHPSIMTKPSFNPQIPANQPAMNRMIQPNQFHYQQH